MFNEATVELLVLEALQKEPDTKHNLAIMLMMKDENRDESFLPNYSCAYDYYYQVVWRILNKLCEKGIVSIDHNDITMKFYQLNNA